MQPFGRGMILALDDRSGTKVWQVNPQVAYLKLLDDVLADPAWRLRQDFDDALLETWLRTRNGIGLPSFLRRGRGVLRLPRLMFTIKSKCFLDSGVRVCTKVGHSCWRRIIDHSGTPHAPGWRAISRGVRGVLQACGLTWEVWSLAEIRPRLDAMLAQLGPPTERCLRCNVELQGRLSVPVHGID